MVPGETIDGMATESELRSMIDGEREPTEPLELEHTQEWDDQSDDAMAIGRSSWLVPLVCGLLATGWLAFFLWAKLVLPGVAPGVQGQPDWIANAIVQGSVPLILIACLYLVLRRNSASEARKYARVSRSLREESEALEDRLNRINGELSLAREFLANQSHELESLGRISTDRLVEYGSQLHELIERSDAGMSAIRDVSEVAHGNMEKLRTHMPVIAQSAKDVANQIGNAGRNAQEQLGGLLSGMDALEARGQTSGEQLSAMREAALATEATLKDTMAAVTAHLADSGASLDEQREALATQLHDSVEAFEAALSSCSTNLRNEAESASHATHAIVEQLDEAVSAIGETARAGEARVKALLGSIDTQLAETDKKLAELDQQGGERSARLAFGLSAIDDKLSALAANLRREQDYAREFQEQLDAISALLDRQKMLVAEDLPQALGQLDTLSDSSRDKLVAIGDSLGGARGESEALAAYLIEVDDKIAGQGEELRKLSDGTIFAWESQAEKIGGLITTMRSAREDAEVLSETATERLSAALRALQAHAASAGGEIRKALEDAVSTSIEQMESESADALERIVRGKAEQIVGKLEAAIDRAVGATGETALHLKDQLIKVDELAGHLERRVAEARERAEEQTDNAFARRVALLTESLNSAAIDIGKILDTDISDTAWAAYLKGDRSVFTRKIVRLLSRDDAKEIALVYENDSDFAEHVNRYIHDFETMLRNLLSTRDGAVLGVSLLSSDTGKLYVALAQAIERFRS